MPRLTNKQYLETHRALRRIWLEGQRFFGVLDYNQQMDGGAIDAIEMSSLIEISAQWTSNAGRGGTQGLMTLLGLLISNAHMRSTMKSGDSSWETLTVEIPLIVAELRKLAEGDTVEVPRSIGFTGLVIQDGTTIALPHGTLRSPRQADRDFLLPESQSATCIFLTTFPLRFLNIESWTPGQTLSSNAQGLESVWDIVRADSQNAERKVDLTRLAILLSAAEDKAWALSQVSSLIVDPSAPGGISQWTGQRFAASHGELDEGAAEQINNWWTKLETEHPVSLDIAMRRVLSAAANRLDPIDGFVDAVVAWENCFGTSTETTFRVTASLSMLLEPESGSTRLALQKKLKKLYEKRSRVVHGALQLSPKDASELRNDALDIATRCLRQLYTDRTDLLALRSEERSVKILLD
jgi:hypothetical protein